MTFADKPFVNTLANVPQMVAGFAYDLANGKVILIRKNRPAWMAGQLNGIGGKVKANESAIDAMVREWFEETGLETKAEEWSLFHYEVRRDGPELFFFCASLPGASALVQSATDEEVVCLDLAAWDSGAARIIPMVYNLIFLIPMGLCYLQHPQHAYDTSMG